MIISRVENNLLSEVYYKLHIFDVLLFVGMILLKSQHKSDILFFYNGLSARLITLIKIVYLVAEVNKH